MPINEATDAQREFAADALRNLLRRIDDENIRYIDGEARLGSGVVQVSHACTEGPKMYMVYTAPPSDITWGLVRDTRQSIIDPSAWPDLDEPVLYYYLLDIEENQPFAFRGGRGSLTPSSGGGIQPTRLRSRLLTSPRNTVTRHQNALHRRSAPENKIGRPRASARRGSVLSAC